MLRRPPRSSPTYILFPSTPLLRPPADRRGTRKPPAPEHLARPRRDPRTRAVPNARIRRPLHRDRHAIPNRRRLPLLRTHVTTSNPRLPPSHPYGRRFSAIRTNNKHPHTRPPQQNPHPNPHKISN